MYDWLLENITMFQQEAMLLDWVCLAGVVVGGLLWLVFGLRKGTPAWLGKAQLACIGGLLVLTIRFGDFEWVLVIAVTLTFICWLIDKIKYPAVRAEVFNEDATKADDALVIKKVKPPRPAIIEHGAGFFMVILVVLVLRSFIFEPFRIPSESMVPTLQNGDFVVVNKFSYDVRLPITRAKLFTVDTPQRGDVAVFKAPHMPEVNYIKRIIGLPGDTVGLRRGRLTINGEAVDYLTGEDYTAYAVDSCGQHMTETLPRVDGSLHAHAILADPKNCSNSGWGRATFGSHEFFGHHGLVENGVVTVKPGHYVVLGDNRNHSGDSRMFGFLPEENLVGKATYIWMNWRHWDHSPQLSRVGTAIE